MSALDDYSIEPLIEQIILYAQKSLSTEELFLFSHFVRLYYSQAHLDDFEDQTPENLYGMAKSHWELLKFRRPKQLKIRLFNPSKEKDGWESRHTIIELVTQDMPFVVDSMCMELNRLNLTIHLMIYMGGMQVERDRKGRALNILPYHASIKGTAIESPVYMEIDRQTKASVLKEIEQNVLRVLKDVRLAVDDWKPLQDRLRETIHAIESQDHSKQSAEVRESLAFLNWLLDDHFTFLGARDYKKIILDTKEHAMQLISGTGLGVLRDEASSQVIRKYSELSEKARKIALSEDQILILSKTNSHSTVHRSGYTDCIGVKILNKAGEIIRERRFIGLYTSSAYTMNPKEIPFVRQKVNAIFKFSGLPIRSHAGKDLMHILALLPRDDLFQGSVDDLFSISMGILHLQERRRIRLFIQPDVYDRYLSCLVYLPKENFNTEILNRMKSVLEREFRAIEITFSTYFSASVLARIHFVVRINPNQRVEYDLQTLETELAEVGKSWQDGFRHFALNAFDEEHGNQVVEKYHKAFPAGYREAFSPYSAVKDVQYIENLSGPSALGMSFYQPSDVPPDVIKFKLFRRQQTVPLSDALPMLENMGLRVVGEQPYCITFSSGDQVWINDFSMTYSKEPTFEVEEVKSIFQEAFNKIWSGDAENDIFNRLVLEAQLNWHEITMLRAYAKYLKQTGFTYSPEYIAETLVNHAGISHLLKDLFTYRFNPDFIGESEKKVEQSEKLIEKMLDDVVVLDEDRILRSYMNIIKTTLRTNYYQLDDAGREKSYLSFKFDPSKIPDLPLPLPKYEIFVYSPRFEGVHLRSDAVARGGIRWSDRREDFRKEVLDLMKAQRVKNALIVPAGAKGGFVPKCLSNESSREALIEEGIACYRGFIQGLLDLTDNLSENHVVPPVNVVRYDDPDPYLVVAADKGTANFSDIANSISMKRKFWLGDAFASGGSAGYDHKKMGITARGAWVSAKRHFQELMINIDETPMTAIGIGDMSGDVFGNGFLLSKKIKLIAAFNHMHIFIDPNPDLELSYQERKRLFSLPRSTWADYDGRLISEGGGVFHRSAKSVYVTPAMKELLDITRDAIVPNDLIHLLLKMPVDLLWNGGIGTYVKSSKEKNDEVGDRANDAIRVNGQDLRVRVVVEGGNLGLTQLARIEYELNGGKINTDFVDNSAGVDCSDHEVNTKILLDHVVTSGNLTRHQRNNLLAKMTDEVATLVLQNNYHQNRALSLAAFLSPSKINLFIRYLNFQEQAGKLNRELEFLPTSQMLLERKLSNLGLTRPELAVLFSYSKIILKEKIRSSTLPEESYLSEYVKYAFPTPLRRRYKPLLAKHRLHREIIATQLSNRIVSNMGCTFTFQMQDETGASIAAIVRAYTIAHKIYHMDQLYADIESLDYKVDPTVQLNMMDDVIQLVRRATRWFLRNRREHVDIEQAIKDFSSHVLGLFRRLPKLILGDDKQRLEERRDTLIASNIPESIAQRMAGLTIMYHSLNIIDAARELEVSVYRVAKIYFILVDQLDLLWFRDQINAFSTDDRWSVLAKSGYKSDLDRIQREITMGVLRLDSKVRNVVSRINIWLAKYNTYIKRWQYVVSEIKGTTVKDFEVFSVAIRELSELAQANKNA